MSNKRIEQLEWKEEVKRLRKNLGLDENYYRSEAEKTTGTPMTVNSIGQSISANQSVGGGITPEEALKISVERVINSGAPINNISFYDEVNWNLNKIGFDPKNPIDIKEFLKKIFYDKQ